jgi:hypothetical protein
VNGDSWEVVERHALNEGERGTSLDIACLTPSLSPKSHMQGIVETRLYVVVGATQVVDGEEIISSGRVILYEVGDPTSRIESSAPLAPEPNTDMKDEETKESKVKDSKVSVSDNHQNDPSLSVQDIDWLNKTSAEKLGPLSCWLRQASEKSTEGGVLHVAQLTNYIAVALGAGSGHSNGCSRFEVFDFTLVRERRGCEGNIAV